MTISQQTKQTYPYHHNVSPLTAYTNGKVVEALMQKTGNFLEGFDVTQRGALIYVCSCLAINKSVKDLLLDHRVAECIDPEIGELLELLTRAELMCVIECILCNTNKSVFG